MRALAALSVADADVCMWVGRSDGKHGLDVAAEAVSTACKCSLEAYGHTLMHSHGMHSRVPYQHDVGVYC